MSEKREEMERLEEELKSVEGTKKELDEEYSAAVESIDTRSLQQEKQTKSKLLISKNEVSQIEQTKPTPSSTTSTAHSTSFSVAAMQSSLNRLLA